MSIVTKTGDTGTTGLFGGKRVSKSDPRLHAYGTVDELNAALGVVLGERDISDSMRVFLLHIQRDLFVIGADLATPLDGALKVRRTEEKDVASMDQAIVQLESVLPPLTRFILPSGVRTGALLHHARTICRRAERHVVDLAAHEGVTPAVTVYLNRLSDYLFLAARFVNAEAGVGEKEV